MNFREMIQNDNKKVFMNTLEFAECRTVQYDGKIYEDIPIILSGLKEQDRRQLVNDHAQGLFLVSTVMHCMASDLGNILPEKGTKMRISDGEDFFREFYIASSVVNEFGILRIELEAIDE